jgi:hypothetical protein
MAQITLLLYENSGRPSVRESFRCQKAHVGKFLRVPWLRHIALSRKHSPELPQAKPPVPAWMQDFQM